MRAAFWRKSRRFVISFVLTALALIFFGDLFLSSKYPEAKVIVYTLVLALPFVFTKFPFCVIDSTYYGTVEKIEVEMTKDARPAAYSYKGYRIYDKGTVYLRIRTPDGRLIRRKVYGGIASLQKYISKYHEDDEVFHLYGTNTVVVLPKEKDTHVACPVCGEMNEKENELCDKCGHTILHDISFVWAGAVPQNKPAEKRIDRPVTIRDDYVAEKRRVYDEFIEKPKKPQRTEEKKTPVSVKAETAMSSTPTNYDSYAEARKNAAIARKMREEQEEKLKKEEANFYADYDAKAIKRAKDAEEKKGKHSFFWEFFSYFGTAVLISHAISFAAIPFIGQSILVAEVNFFSQTIIFSAILFFRFYVFGRNEFTHKRVGMKKMLASGVLSFLIYAAAYAVYHGSGIFVPPARIHGDGIHALALILCGAGKRSVMEQPLQYDAVHGWINPSAPFPEYYPLTLAVSFLLSAVYYVWLMWFAYKFGIDERDMERRDMFDGTEKAEMRRKRRSFAKCFIPFVNYYPIYSWSYEYWVNPEPDRKLKYFFRGVALMIVGMTAIEILRYLFFQVCKSELLNGIVFYLSLHLVGCVISLVAYFDDKRHEKLMRRYRD